MSRVKLPSLHPGEVLREEFMEPLGLSAYRVAQDCHLPRTRIERIVREEVGITADTALRLGKLFNTSAEFWLNLQNRYEVETAKANAKVAKELKAIKPREIAAE